MNAPNIVSKPASWRSIQLKHVVSYNEDTIDVRQSPDTPIRYVDISSVEYGKGIIAHEDLALGDAPSRARRAAKVGDVLVSTVRTYLKAIAPVSNEHADCVFSTGFAILRARDQHLAPAYLKWLMLDENLIQRIVAHSEGLSYPAINASVLVDLKVKLPSVEEQGSIALFLDSEIACIDRLVRHKESFIELLRVRALAYADLLVTGQVGEQRQHKSSSTPWAPLLPEHWAVKRAKFLFQEMARPVLPDDEIITAFRDGQVCLRTKRRLEGYTFAEKEVGYQHISKGDLVIHTMDAFAGAIGVSEDDGKATGEYAVCTSLSDGVNSMFYAHVLRCMARRNYIYVLCPAVRERAPRFRFVRFAPVPLPVPPRREQDEIVERIEHTFEQSKALTAKTRRSIELLKEYRSSLITAAVTGKIDVRNAA